MGPTTASDERPSQIGLSAEKDAPRMADTSVADTTDAGSTTKSSLPAVRGNDLDLSKTSPCSWCQHAEFIHAHAGPCLFSGCECPFFTPAEPDVVALG